MHWNFTDVLVPSEKRFSCSDGTIIAEIGFGNGEYLEHLARMRPECTVTGIEVSQWCVTKAARRALAAGLRNVRLIQGDARSILRYAFEPGCVSEAYMNFPCPWPKRRHAERRVASQRFAQLICGRLALGGNFTLATDVEWYALQTQEAFLADGSFTADPVEVNPKRDYVTRYERKWRKMGLDTFVARMTKISDAPDEMDKTDEKDRKTGEEGEKELRIMTDPGIKGLGLRGRLSAVLGETIRKDGYVVIFKELFMSGDDAALLSAISVDEGFEQHYYIKAVQSGGETLGKLDAIGRPYRTPGVRASLRRLSEIAGVRF
jgi:tRNA (guanine-N7-)-methyltransferase